MVYTAMLGSVSEFAPMFWRLAVEQHIPQSEDTSVTADGAEWIWNLVADLFPDSLQIVDWYHACQHLAEAAEALYPTNLEASLRWQQERRSDLYLGQIHKITQRLERAGLASLAAYFHTH